MKQTNEGQRRRITGELARWSALAGDLEMTEHLLSTVLDTPQGGRPIPFDRILLLNTLRLAWTLLLRDREDRAERLFSSLVEDVPEQRRLLDVHASARVGLGVCRARRGDREAGLALAEEAARELARELGGDHPFSQRGFQWVVKLHEEGEGTGRAAEWRKRLAPIELK